MRTFYYVLTEQGVTRTELFEQAARWIVDAGKPDNVTLRVDFRPADNTYRLTTIGESYNA